MNQCGSDQCNGEKKILNGSSLRKKKTSNWIKVKLKMRLFLLTFYSFAAAGLV